MFYPHVSYVKVMPSCCRAKSVFVYSCIFFQTLRRNMRKSEALNSLLTQTWFSNVNITKQKSTYECIAK